MSKLSTNRLIPIKDKGEKFKKLLPYLIKPLETRDWWDRMLDLFTGSPMRFPAIPLNSTRAEASLTCSEKFEGCSQSEMIEMVEQENPTSFG